MISSAESASLGSSEGNLPLVAAEPGGCRGSGAGEVLVVPHSVGAGAVLCIAIFNHVMNYISHSSSDKNCLAHLKGWKKCGSQQVLVCTAEVWEVKELGSIPSRAVDLLCLPALISPCKKQLCSFSQSTYFTVESLTNDQVPFTSCYFTVCL